MFGEIRSLEALSRQESIQLLSGEVVGRVVFTHSALPAVVPVTFAILDEAVVLRTAEGTRLAAAADRGVLALEADEIDPVARTGWSVVVTGIAELVTDPIRRAVIHAIVEPFAPGENDVYVSLPFTVVTGRRVVSTACEPVTGGGCQMDTVAR
jgi:nitroimidazol reductase NimA-like FMN-containing flavoprotein (pyridoxamine 5'-phosphate oxidase superfamily)